MAVLLDIPKAADYRPSAGAARTELHTKATELVKGEGFATIGGNAPLTDPKDVARKGEAVSKALRKNARASNDSPSAVFKGMSPSFIGQFGQMLSFAPQNVAMQQFVNQLNSVLSSELGKNISLTSPLSTGLVPYDLLAPSRLIYPVYSPLRNKLPRTQGQGTSRHVKVFTGVSGSHTGGTSVLRWSIPEFPGGGSFSSWPNQLPGSGSQTTVDVNIPYKFFGITEALSWLAQFSGQGFEDIAALANLILLQESMLAEEHTLLEAANAAIPTPGTPTLTARAASSSETANTGVTSNVYAKITAVNYWGETVASTAGNVAWSSGNVVDVAISPSAGAAQYNIYVSTGTVAGTFYLMASSVGAHKYTLQGALPTGGTQPPTVNTTNSSNDYDGMFNILGGNTASNTYPSTGYQAGYRYQALGSKLTNAAVFDVFAGLWDNSSALNVSDSGGFRADPQEMIAEGLDASNFAQSILSQSGGGQAAYQLRIDQDEIGSIAAGAAVSQIQNSVTRSMVKIVVHPYLPQGNALFLSYQMPQSFSNVANAWEVTNVQDYVSIAWPVTDVTFRYSLFLYGALVGIAPQFSAHLGGIQRTGDATNGNWT